MSDTLITCPECGHRFAVSAALNAQLQREIETRLKDEHDARLAAAVAQARDTARSAVDLELADLQARLGEGERKAAAAREAELALRQRTRELEEETRSQGEKIRAELETRLRREADEQAKAAADAAAAKARGESSAALAELQGQLAEQEERARLAQEAELGLRREKTALEQRARDMDLEVARKLDAEKRTLEEGIRRSIGEEQNLRLKEKEKQIDDLRRALDDAKRKSEQGSQERQGEVLELDIQAGLERQFPGDDIQPVAKGRAGADLVQEVRNGAGKACGRIVWETKNTRHWSPAWIGKLKDDQREARGSLAVLVSVALPEDIHEFACVDGVWVASPRAWPALAVALREQLIQVAFAHAANDGRQEKMDLLYRYLAGDPFRQKVQGIVEAFTVLQDQLQRERRAMEKLWKEREKQIERVVVNTVGMYGEMSGILGGSLPEIPALTLEGAAGLIGSSADGA